MYLFESLNQLIQNYLPEDQIKRLRQAYLVARDAHEGQTRSSGEPYITHPVAVACILAEMKLDYETLMAALLHDVIEDTPATYQDMEQLFGKSVAELVEGVSKLDKLKFRDKNYFHFISEGTESQRGYFLTRDPLAAERDEAGSLNAELVLIPQAGTRVTKRGTQAAKCREMSALGLYRHTVDVGESGTPGFRTLGASLSSAWSGPCS